MDMIERVARDDHPCNVCGWDSCGARDEGCLLPEYDCPRTKVRAVIIPSPNTPNEETPKANKG